MTRPTSAQRGYNARWAKASKAFRHGKVCVMCEARGIVKMSQATDHIIAVSGPDDPLFWDENNWQPLCIPCHSSKTGREDGARGNAKGKGKVRADCGVDGVPVDSGHHWRK